MKTNIKNGMFIYGIIPVDTAQIKIGDALTNEGVVFETGADGLYTILASTDENGIVKELTIDIGEYKHSVFHGEIEVDDLYVLVKDGEPFVIEDDDLFEIEE
ncbi:hypothetical protein MHB40_22155 [Lysinibacillus sp. FSL K6-0057]|uniref:hypothetical protein n=1 Tax=Lysinibacillus sp. FSL K6-0057 TaxID=2921411 RepID=UPI00315A339A